MEIKIYPSGDKVLYIRQGKILFEKTSPILQKAYKEIENEYSFKKEFVDDSFGEDMQNELDQEMFFLTNWFTEGQRKVKDNFFKRTLIYTPSMSLSEHDYISLSLPNSSIEHSARLKQGTFMHSLVRALLLEGVSVNKRLNVMCKKLEDAKPQSSCFSSKSMSINQKMKRVRNTIRKINESLQTSEGDEPLFVYENDIYFSYPVLTYPKK